MRIADENKLAFPYKNLKLLVVLCIRLALSVNVVTCTVCSCGYMCLYSSV